MCNLYFVCLSWIKYRVLSLCFCPFCPFSCFFFVFSYSFCLLGFLGLISQDARSAAVEQVFASSLSIGIFIHYLHSWPFKWRLNQRLLHPNYWFQQIAVNVVESKNLFLIRNGNNVVYILCKYFGYQYVNMFGTYKYWISWWVLPFHFWFISSLIRER